MITATTPTEIKRRLGGLAYTLSGLARLSELKPVRARISIDGSEPVSSTITAMAIANSRYAGGGFDVAPEADTSDGYLDLSILSADGLQTGIPGLLSAAEKGDPTATLVSRARFRTAVLEMDEPFHLNLDGEPTIATRFEVSVLPQRLRFAFPKVAL